jgi:hypothetical protein
MMTNPKKMELGVVLLKYRIIQYVKSHMLQSTLIVIYSLSHSFMTYGILFWRNSSHKTLENVGKRDMGL